MLLFTIYNNLISPGSTDQDDCANLIDQLPLEMRYAIFSHLNHPADLLNACLVNKKWESVANDKRLWKPLYPEVPQDAYGAKQWLEFLGADVGEEPPLPINIQAILESLCPFTGKKVKETHFLLLIPKFINGIPFTLASLGKLFAAKFPGSSKHKNPGYLYALGVDLFKNDETQWVLMTKDILLESKGIGFSANQGLVSKQGQQKYQIPRVIEAAACIFAQHSRDKHMNFYKDIYTYCQDEFKEAQMYVGGFEDSSLHAINEVKLYEGYKGVAPVWRLHRASVKPTQSSCVLS